MHGALNSISSSPHQNDGIDMPIMEIKLPKEVKPDDVMGGDDTVLESMFRILFCGEGPQFKEALEKESAKLLFKQQR